MENVTINLGYPFYLYKRSDIELGSFSVSYIEAEREILKGRQPGPADVLGDAQILGLVAAGAGVVSAAITAVFAYVASKKGGKIVIKGKSGRSIEIPVGTTKKELKTFIKMAREIDADVIEVGDYTSPPKPPPPPDRFEEHRWDGP